jgi:hypothetical protein
MPDSLATHLIQFYQSLVPPGKLPVGIKILFPQKNREVMKLVKIFFNKYYDDNNSRQLLFGINPGRLGGGITGINFTAPRQLKDNCHIAHPFEDSSELSAEFIYEVIERYGGPAKFYADYYITAISSLGFTKNGINMNYYDDKKLQGAITPFVIENINRVLGYGFKRDRCICIGEGENYKYFTSLNREHQFFTTIIPLPHPRFILQYRRKQKERYIQQYLNALQVK